DVRHLHATMNRSARAHPQRRGFYLSVDAAAHDDPAARGQRALELAAFFDHGLLALLSVSGVRIRHPDLSFPLPYPNRARKSPIPSRLSSMDQVEGKIFMRKRQPG